MQMNSRARSTMFPAVALTLLTFFGCQQSDTAMAPAPVSEEGDFEASVLAAGTAITGPMTIDQPGSYYLANDIGVDPATGDGIVITASNVRLVFVGHKITGLGNKVGRGVVLSDVEHVRVKGGPLEQVGFGAVLMNANHCEVTGLDVRGGDEFADPPNGVPPQIGIMLVNSAYNLIRVNRFDEVNLGIFVRGGGSHDNRIRGNEVLGGDYGLLAICYNPAPGGDPAGPYNDDVSKNRLIRFGTGIQTSAGSHDNGFRFNVIHYFAAPWVDFNGTNGFLHNQTMQLVP